jgi:SAM-dependent methyltransferase
MTGAGPSERRRPRRGALRERLAPPFEDHLERAVGDARTVLDVGCGANSPLGRFARRYEHAVGVDLSATALRRARAAGVHAECRLMDVLDVAEAFEPGSFEACVAFDVLEHLRAEDGLALLGQLERVASRRVVVLTPNGFLPQDGTLDNPLQAHLSGWSSARLKDLGYAVRGVNGVRVLRGHKASMRFRPRRAWGVVSDLTQPLAERAAGLGFHLLAVKEL